MSRQAYIKVPLSKKSNTKKRKKRKNKLEIDVNVSERVLQSYIHELKKSYDNNFLIYIEYINNENAFSSRFVEFYSLKKSKAGETLLICRLINLDGSLRSFRLKRIISLFCTDLPFKPKWEKSWL